MQGKFCLWSLLLSSLLLLFATQFVLVAPASASATKLATEIRIVREATSLNEAPCDPACPVWISGVEGPLCDPAKQCATLLLPEPGLPSPITSPPAPETTAQPAPDRFFEPMRFVIVRSSASGCEPTCPEWISASGKITSDSPRELRKLLKKLGKRKLPVVIESPGGEVNAAMDIGRMIRSRGLDVAIAKTGFDACTVAQTKCGSEKFADGSTAGFPFPGDAACFSACPFVLAGGVNRLVGNWSQVGVHQITSSYNQMQLTYRERYEVRHGKKRLLDRKVVKSKFVGSFTTTEMSKAYRRKIKAYFKEMGTDPAIVDRMLATPASDISILSYMDMTKFKLITGAGDLMSVHICDQQDKAYNCIVLEANGSNP